MNERFLRELAARSLAALLGTVAVSYGLEMTSAAAPSFGKNIQLDNGRVVSAEEIQKGNLGNVYINMETGVAVNRLEGPYLVIDKPEGKNYKVSLEDLYMERSLKISILGLEDRSFSREGLYTGSKNDSCLKKAGLVYDYEPASSSYTAVYEAVLDRVYAYQVYEDEKAIYIELWEPSELYSRILVVDAGHGGNDIGTYSLDMKYYEKDINLNIVKYLKKLLDKERIKVYYTRLEDEKIYLNPRIDLANELKADLFVSVHCNSSDTAEARGCEVLYGTKNQKNLAFTSKDLAEICLNAMVKGSNLPNRGLVKGNDIHIIGKAKIPAALVETGFLTNEKDLEYLIEEKNQKEMAEYIYQGIMEAFSKQEENY